VFDNLTLENITKAKEKFMKFLNPKILFELNDYKIFKLNSFQSIFVNGVEVHKNTGFHFSYDIKSSEDIKRCINRDRKQLDLQSLKPHIIKDGLLGQVIDEILQAGFEISAAELFYLSRKVIEEFYDVYKGVLPEYLPIIEHFSNGPSVALEIRQENAVASFREFAGPNDPEIAKYLKPESLRAKFGLDKVKNAIHCCAFTVFIIS
jgi:nucleoside diphosphate kinase